MKKTMMLATLAVAAVLLILAPARATEELAEKEGVSCTTCHDKPGSKLLTDQGKYYELLRSFDGFDEIESSFGRCTHCHVRKPGSEKLTSEGKDLAKVAEGMAELSEWVRTQHPEAIAAPEEDEEQP